VKTTKKGGETETKKKRNDNWLKKKTQGGPKKKKKKGGNQTGVNKKRGSQKKDPEGREECQSGEVFSTGRDKKGANSARKGGPERKRESTFPGR